MPKAKISNSVLFDFLEESFFFFGVVSFEFWEDKDSLGTFKFVDLVFSAADSRCLISSFL